MNLRKILVLILAATLLPSFAASAQKNQPTPVPVEEEEFTGTDNDGILTLPILLSGEPLEFSFEGTDGGLLAVFNASEGDEVDISMTSEDLDSYIVVFDWAAMPVAQNDDSDTSLDSLIEGFEVPADGTYFILATTFLGSSSSDDSAEGTFELMVEGNTQPADIASDSFSYQVYTLEFDAVVDAEITEETPAYFGEFAGEEGQQVTIDAPSDDLDTFLMLFDFAGNRIATDDDSGDVTLAAHIEAELPATDSYLVLITTYNYKMIAEGSSDVTEGIINFSLE